VRIRSIVAAAWIVLIVAGLPATAKSKSGAARLYPYDGYPELTDEERSLSGVPYAEGAPALMLLEAGQNRWEDVNLIRTDYYRRLKILTEAGVEDYSDFTYTLYGDWRVKDVTARTVLPDGTEVDAGEGVFRQRSAESGMQVVSIAFPQVRVGAILDLHITTMIDSVFVTPWIIQSEIPVVQSEFIVVPPVGLKFRKVLFAYDPSKENERKFRVADRGATSWKYEDVAPLPQVPNRPSRSEIAAKLIIIVDSYKDETTYIPLAPDWKGFIKARSEYIDDWIKARHANAADLARQVTGDASTPLDKAEAIRESLQKKVRVEYTSTGRIHDSPDEVLAEGFGTSSDLALTAAAMLRAVGVGNTPVQYRRRSLGLVPPDFPIPSLLDDTILRIDVGEGPTFFAPAADLPAGRLPWDAQGVLGVPLDGKSVQPIEVPDFRAQDNRTERTTTGKLAADGRITAETSVVFRGVASDRWRRSLQDLDEDGRRELIRDRLRRFIPGLQLTELELRNLENSAMPFALRCSWEAEGYVSSAGQRLLFDPFLFSRIRAEEWPPAERAVPVDLGETYETFDTLNLELPQGSGEVTLPETRRLNAGPVGMYEVELSSSGGRVIAKRHMKLEIYRFPVQSYDSLRKWFVDVSAVDDSSVVVSMP